MFCRVRLESKQTFPKHFLTAVLREGLTVSTNTELAGSNEVLFMKIEGLVTAGCRLFQRHIHSVK